MTASAQSTLCEGTCNSSAGSVVQAQVPAAPMYFFRPETGEILECPAESVAAVRQEIALLDKLLDDLLTTQFASQQALDDLLRAQKGMDAGAVAQAQAAADQALGKEAKARDAMFKEFKDLPKYNDGGKGLMELLPLATRKGDALYKSKRITYVRSEKVKNHTRRYHNLPGDAAKLKSFYTKDEDGRYKLDKDKLAKAFSTVPVKAELAKSEVTWWAGGWAPEFVEAFNAAHDAKKAGEAAEKAMAEDASLQFSGGASLLRFFAGAGGSAEVEMSGKAIKDLLKGRGEVSAKLSAAGRAGVELASAKINPKLYLPTKHGLQLAVRAGWNAKGGKQELDLGYMRMLIDCELSASCGASAVAQGGLEFKLKADLTQGVRGAPARKTAAAMAKPKARVDKFEAEAAGSGELSAFAGAEAGASVGGALQWQRPEILEFRNFAKIDAKGKGLAGIGGTVMFDIRYQGGKFRVTTKLGACVGLGVKGEIAAEVGVVELMEFDLWFKHQVVNALDQNLKYFEDQAWKAFVYMKALAIVEGKKLVDYLGRSAEDLAEAWLDLIRTAGEETLRRIRASRDYVLTSVAEVKALLFGLLELLKRNLKGMEREIEDAVRWLFGAVQTVQEADNVYQRIALEQGVVIDKAQGSQRIAVLMGGQTSLERLVAELKVEPTPGYALAFCTEPAYQFAKGMGTHLAWQRSGMGQTNSMLA